MSAGRVLITRAGSRAARRARSRCRASRAGRARARRCRSRTRSPLRRPAQQPVRRVLPLGRQLISTATPCSRHARRPPRRRTRTPAGPRPRTIRPVQWPRTSTCGFDTAATMRGVISAPGMRSLECTLATTTSSRPSRSSPGQAPSSRMSTSIPVSRRNGASSAFSSADQSSCYSQPLRGQSVGHGQPGRVVGQREPLVAESRAASAISSGGLPPSDQSEWVWQSPRRAARSRPLRWLRLRQQPGQVAGLLARQRLPMTVGGRRADAGQLPQRARRQPARPARRAAALDDLRRPAGTPAPGRSGALGPLQLERDLMQRPDRVHAFRVSEAGAVKRPGPVVDALAGTGDGHGHAERRTSVRVNQPTRTRR